MTARGGPEEPTIHPERRQPAVAPVLRGERVVLRPLTESDVAPLAALLAEPGVAEWWMGYDEARVRSELLDGKGYAGVFAIDVDGAIAGAIMYEEENDPDYRFASLDVSLGSRFLGRGLGPEALRTLIGYLIRERGHHHILIDPNATNERAIAAYRKVGFKPVGILRQYERRPEGWADALLMDLVADEFETQQGLPDGERG